MKKNRQMLSKFIGSVLLYLSSTCQASEQSTDAAGSWEKVKQWSTSTYQQAKKSLQSQPESHFPILWQEITPKLDEVLVLQDARQALPESAWFVPDQSSAQTEINQLLNEAADILGMHQTQNIRDRIRDHETEIKQLQTDIEQLQREKIAAPSDSMWKRTVSGYNKKISKLKTSISQHQEQIEELKQEYRLALNEIGLELSAQQLDFLLTTVVGDQVIEMSIAFDNVKVLTEKLEHLTDESQENIVTARKYYGMYTVLLKILDTLYQQAIDSIDQQYLPKIVDIVEKTESLMDKTQDIKTNQTGKKIIRANLAAQKLTIKAAKMYQRYLMMQRKDIVKAQTKLQSDLTIANNTYQTVQLSGELAGMMRSGRKLFDKLLNMQIPTLRTYQNHALQSEFSHLTKQLSAVE
jgi:hypothetical protein